MARRKTDSVQVKLRISGELHRRLEQSRKRSGNATMNGEIVQRLERSFQQEDAMGSRENVALVQLLVAGAIGRDLAGDEMLDAERHAITEQIGAALARALGRAIPDFYSVQIARGTKEEGPHSSHTNYASTEIFRADLLRRGVTLPPEFDEGEKS